ncbi:thioredoxin-like domain-containing protein [Pollutibacter soli]|uniref:thioredoxin-like domain-containing protein n=1 Tax=Pollutibacter soli TaxID=3034157 RepID=UPI0030132B6F
MIWVDPVKRLLIILLLFLARSVQSQQKDLNADFVVEVENKGAKSVGLQFKDYSYKIPAGHTKVIKRRIADKDRRFVVFIILPDSSARNGYRQQLVRIFSDSPMIRKITIDTQSKVRYNADPGEELVFQYHSALTRSNFWKLTDSVITANPANAGSAEIIMSQLCNAGYPLDRIESNFEKLDQNIRKSSTGKSIAGYISSRRNFMVGAPVANFSLKDSTGKLTQLTDVKSEYVLLDFWFSSCKPCIESFPRLKELYSAVDRNRLEIVGLSVDAKSKEWKAAISKYNLPWINLHDYAESIAFFTFAIEHFPSQILINAQRKIISINPSLEELSRIVSKPE